MFSCEAVGNRFSIPLRDILVTILRGSRNTVRCDKSRFSEDDRLWPEVKMKDRADFDGTVEIYESVYRLLVEALKTISKGEGGTCRNRNCTQLRHDRLCPVRTARKTLRLAREISPQ